MAGRPPKPRALKILQGTLRKHRDTGPEAPSKGVGGCPEHLEGKARELWEKWAPIFTEMGCLRECHALAFAEWMQAEADIITLRDAGEMPSVALRKHAVSLAVQFGGTASASSRVHVEPKKPESKLKKFLG